MKKIILVLITLIFYFPQSIYSQSKFNFQNYVIESLKKINDRMDRLDDRMDRLENRMDKLNDKVDDRFYTLIGIIFALFLTVLGGFVSLFVFIAQRTQPVYTTEPAPEPRARQKTKTIYASIKPKRRSKPKTKKATV